MLWLGRIPIGADFFYSVCGKTPRKNFEKVAIFRENSRINWGAW